MTLSPNEFVRDIYGKPVVVKLNSGVFYKGILTALDGNMNIAMESMTEHFPNGEQGEQYGDAFIRGNNVAMEDSDSQYHFDFSEYGFEPLRISKSLLYFKLPISKHPLLWKMNLGAYCHDTNTFYLAIQDKILAFSPPISNIFVERKHDTLTLDVEERCIHSNPPLYTWIMVDHLSDSRSDEELEINAIRMCKLGSSPVLVAATNKGRVNIWSTKLPFQLPISIQNHRESSWGIALASQNQLLAISANNHTISIYRTGFHLAFNECIHVEQDCSGHEHNIPSLDFNSTEDFLVSGSIDGSIRIWSIMPQAPHAQLIYTKSFKDVLPWVWSIRCLNPFFIDRIPFSELVHHFSSDIISTADRDEVRGLDLINLHHLLWNKTSIFRDEINGDKDHNSLDYIKDVMFCSTSHGICIPKDQILEHSLWFFSHQMGFFAFPHDVDRLNMTCWIPELSVMVVGSQFGYVVVTRIVNLKEYYNGSPAFQKSAHSDNQEYFIIIEDILPRQIERPRNFLTGMDALSGIFSKFISHLCCLLYLLYQNGSVHIFKLEKNQNSMSIHQL